jgi:hypothetical protein
VEQDYPCFKYHYLELSGDTKKWRPQSPSIKAAELGSRPVLLVIDEGSLVSSGDHVTGISLASRPGWYAQATLSTTTDAAWK